MIRATLSILSTAIFFTSPLAPVHAAAPKITNKMVGQAFQQAFDEGFQGKRLEFETLILPGKRSGWLFSTSRSPTLFLNNSGSKSRLTLGLVWNGVDGRPWGFVGILSVLLKGVCSAGGGMTDTKFAVNVILRKGKDLEKRRPLGGNAGTYRHTLYRGLVGKCRVVKRYKGGRWHTMMLTFTRVQ